MSNDIKIEDIQPGDTIRVSFKLDGVFIERTGKAWTVTTSSVRTEDKGYLWNDGWAGEPVITLLNRPKPPLPTEPGTIILIGRSFRSDLYILREGMWENRDRSRVYTPEAVATFEWKLAKVVEA